MTELMWVQMCKLVMLLECWLAHSFLEPYRMSLDDDFVCFCAPCLRYVRYSKTTPKTANSLSFSSDLLRGVHARASVEQLREMRTGHFPPRALCHARGHYRLFRVSLDGLRNKRDCSKSTKSCQIPIFNTYR